jgi:hypothetical protein
MNIAQYGYAGGMSNLQIIIKMHSFRFIDYQKNTYPKSDIEKIRRLKSLLYIVIILYVMLLLLLSLIIHSIIK